MCPSTGTKAVAAEGYFNKICTMKRKGFQKRLTRCIIEMY